MLEYTSILRSLLSRCTGGCYSYTLRLAGTVYYVGLGHDIPSSSLRRDWVRSMYWPGHGSSPVRKVRVDNGRQRRIEGGTLYVSE